MENLEKFDYGGFIMSTFEIDFFELCFLAEACIPPNTFDFKGKKWGFLPQDMNYVVSEDGDVISLGRNIIRSNGYRQYIHPKLMEPIIDKKGYKFLRPSNLGDVKCYKVHQLVMMTFRGHHPDGTVRMVVDHIDMNRENNNVNNLRILTNRENCIRGIKSGISGIIGVTYNKEKRKWKSTIISGKNKYHLGYFDSVDEAGRYYNAALDCITSGNESKILIKKRTKKSKYKGVTVTKYGKYRGAFRFKDKFYDCGTYDTEEEAYENYLIKYNNTVK